MTAQTYHNGIKIFWDSISKQWEYEDGLVIDEFRKCPKCTKLPDENGHDACLGILPGVKNACCGHGVSNGYVQFENDVIIRFELKSIDKSV